jgi:excisionase family DNA binding protein
MSDAPTFETETINAVDAARFLHISKDTLYDLARSGEIPGCKVGRSWVFMKSLLTEYLRCRSNEQPDSPKIFTRFEFLSRTIDCSTATMDQRSAVGVERSLRIASSLALDI